MYVMMYFLIFPDSFAQLPTRDINTMVLLPVAVKGTSTTGSPSPNVNCTMNNTTVAASNAKLAITFAKNAPLYIDKNKAHINIGYNISKDNNLNNITAIKNNSIYLINIHSRGNGSLILGLPTDGLIISKKQNIDSPYLVSDNQRILGCKEIKHIPKARILNIDFANGTRRITIIGSSFVDLPPKAVVTPNLQIVKENSLVKLNGTQSNDPEGGPLVYSWKQTAGRPIILNGSNTATPTFNATAGVSNAAFQLTVKNSANQNDSATENIIVSHPPLRPSTGVNGTAAFHTIIDSGLPYFFMLIIALVMVTPLVIATIFDYRKKSGQTADGQKASTGLLGMSGLYRTLMTFGVILLVGSVLFYILILIALNAGNVMSPAMQSLVDVFKNLATILGTALATIIAFYFGMRGSEAAAEKAAGAASAKPSTEDKASPTVLSTSPGDGDDNVSGGSPVTASFNKAMNSSTINTNTFIVREGATNNRIGGKVDTSPDHKTAIFSPDKLEPGKVYIARIDGAVKDEAGNGLSISRTWSFKTK
jgi:Bacterial Ig-like domain